jgi:hypothetical protein
MFLFLLPLQYNVTARATTAEPVTGSAGYNAFLSDTFNPLTETEGATKLKVADA